ncbi:MAG: AAA family ATPase [Candidatus Saccharimonas sp.]
MKDLIFIAGAPGSGKSTIAKALHEKFGTPMFEFGWIPEFQNTGSKTLSYTEEESLSFENLVLVAKNYAKHGFKNVIITDLNNDFIVELPEIFKDYDFAIYTLRIIDGELLKSRVLDESRSSGYRDWEKALQINQQLNNREQFKNETFIDIAKQPIEQVVEQICAELNK